MQKELTTTKIGTLKHILLTFAGAVVLLCAAVLVLPHFDCVQDFLGRSVADALAEKLGTEVSVGKVHLGIPNSLVIDDVMIKDRDDKNMLDVERLASRIELMPLISDGRIVIDKVELYDADIDVYRKVGEEDFNFQFVVDAFASEDTTHTPLDLTIKRIFIKNSNVAFNDDSFGVNANNLTTLMRLNHVTDDSLKAVVESFNSSIKVNNPQLTFNNVSMSGSTAIALKKGKYSLSDFTLTQGDCRITIPSATYDSNNDSYFAQLSDTKIAIKDLEECGLLNEGIRLPDYTLTVDATVDGVGKDIRFRSLDVKSDDGGIALQMAGNEIKNLRVTADAAGDVLQAVDPGVAEALAPNNKFVLGDVGYRGLLKLNEDGIDADGKVTTGLGDLEIDGFTDMKSFNAKVKTDGFSLAEVTGNDDLGKIAADVTAKGAFDLTKLDADGTVRSLIYKGVEYKDVAFSANKNGDNVDGSLKIDNVNCKADMAFDGAIGGKKKIRLNGHVADFNPHALRLINDYANTNFGMNINADFEGSSLNNIVGNATIDNFTINTPNSSTHINSLRVESVEANGQRELILNSDFADADIKGQFEMESLFNNIIYAVKSRLPSIPWLPDVKETNPNRYQFDVSIRNTDAISQFVDLPLTLTQPMNVNGSIDDYRKMMNIDVFMPRFKIDDDEYKDGEVMISTPNEKMKVDLFVSKVLANKEHFNIKIDAEAADDQLSTLLTWDNPFSTMFSGRMSATTEFFKDF
ncbi:MAG: hypothetical protein Q4F34_06930, partial [Prevotellaceae bacterium]|nr:hypothetical protein [Prevotellaceae bacterium]